MMERHIGEWVILKDNDIIEHNSDIKVILENAKKYADDEITISKVPSTKYGFIISLGILGHFTKYISLGKIINT